VQHFIPDIIETTIQFCPSNFKDENKDKGHSVTVKKNKKTKMTNVSDLHNFRVQTPSFLINNSGGDGVIELSNLQQQRIIVEQLRREAAIKRISVSQAIEDLKKYMSDHGNEDYLLVGFPTQKSNPFREKSSCSVL